jgi:hypothetical protein
MAPEFRTMMLRTGCCANLLLCEKTKIRSADKVCQLWLRHRKLRNIRERDNSLKAVKVADFGVA